MPRDDEESRRNLAFGRPGYKRKHRTLDQQIDAYNAGVERKRRSSGNPNHVPAGRPDGGQFTTPTGKQASGSVKPKPQRKPPSDSQRVRAADRRAARKAADKAHEEAMAPFLPPKDEQFYPRRFDPAQLTYGADGELDAYGVARMYGKRNLRKYYKGITAATMREHARDIMARNPGTKPKSMSRKDDLVDYIVAHTPDSGDRPPKAAPATRPLPQPKPRAPRKRKAAPRAPRAKVPSGAMAARQASGMSAEEWNRAQKIARKNPTGRMPTRMNRVRDAYPHTGQRTRRTKAQATVEYMDARGALARYRRARG